MRRVVGTVMVAAVAFTVVAAAGGGVYYDTRGSVRGVDPGGDATEVKGEAPGSPVLTVVPVPASTTAATVPVSSTSEPAVPAGTLPADTATTTTTAPAAPEWSDCADVRDVLKAVVTRHDNFVASRRLHADTAVETRLGRYSVRAEPRVCWYKHPLDVNRLRKPHVRLSFVIDGETRSWIPQHQSGNPWRWRDGPGPEAWQHGRWGLLPDDFEGYSVSAVCELPVNRPSDRWEGVLVPGVDRFECQLEVG